MQVPELIVALNVDMGFDAKYSICLRLNDRGAAYKSWLEPIQRFRKEGII